jgi:hypothetical protein
MVLLVKGEQQKKQNCKAIRTSKQAVWFLEIRGRGTSNVILQNVVFFDVSKMFLSPFLLFPSTPSSPSPLSSLCQGDR